MGEPDELHCPSCGSLMEKGNLILSSRTGLWNFLFGGYSIKAEGKLTWQNDRGNKSGSVVGRNAKLRGYRCQRCDFVAFKMTP